MDLPLYFPDDCNRRLTGLQDPHRKKFSVVFQDFGRHGHVDVKFSNATDCSESSDSDASSQPVPVYTAQRKHSKDQDRILLCAENPTLPLSDVPIEQVPYPFKDRIIGDLPQLPAKVKWFSRSLNQVSTYLQKGQAMWSKTFFTAKKTLDAANPDHLSPFRVKTIQQNLPHSVKNLLDAYEYLSQQETFRVNNPSYSGGLLDCVTEDKGKEVTHLLFHARGRELNRLTLTKASPSDYHMMSSYVLAEKIVPSVFQVEAAKVGDQIFLGTRHKDSFSIFSVPVTAISADTHSRSEELPSLNSMEVPFTSDLNNRSAEFTLIDTFQCEVGDTPTSFCISPYLPAESLFCTDVGSVYVWSAERGVQKVIDSLPKFQCPDIWLHAYYGSHPRHIILADRTAVQMMDHRDGFRRSIDLFALPSRLVHKKEHIMAAHPHGGGSPLHAVATSHCLFLVDQRFAGTPVLQLYPDLLGSLQYLASADYISSSVASNSVLLVGSQYPAEVLCYPFSQGSGLPVTLPLNPWRLSQKTDLCYVNCYGSFIDAADPSIFQQRLGLSLGGLAVARGPLEESIVTYQVDSYGEVFFQRYSAAENPRLVCKTGVSFSARKNEYVPMAVKEHMKLWAQHLQQQIESSEEKSLNAVPRKRRSKHHSKQQLSTRMSDRLRSESGVEESCELCHDDAETLHLESGGRGRLLCPSCHLIQRNLYGQGTNSGEDTAVRYFCDSEKYIEEVILPCESYSQGATTAVHLQLMKEKPHSESIKIREERHAELLKQREEKRRMAVKERKQKRREALGSDLDLADEAMNLEREHTVFNSEEHQRQNALINEIMSKAQESTRTPATVSLDTPDEFEASATESENTPPVDESFDLFADDSAKEDTPAMSTQLSSFLLPDDDDFFGSQNIDSWQPLHTSTHGSPGERQREKQGEALTSDLQPRIPLTPSSRHKDYPVAKRDQERSYVPPVRLSLFSSASRMSPISSKVVIETQSPVLRAGEKSPSKRTTSAKAVAEPVESAHKFEDVSHVTPVRARKSPRTMAEGDSTPVRTRKSPYPMATPSFLQTVSPVSHSPRTKSQIEQEKLAKFSHTPVKLTLSPSSPLASSEKRKMKGFKGVKHSFSGFC